jgi:hypothetical protein
MTECDRLRADAPGLAALRSDDPERVAAWSHASGCPGCASALREAERLQTLIAGCEPAPLPVGATERVARAIVAELRREARRRTLGRSSRSAPPCCCSSGSQGAAPTRPRTGP